MNALCRAAEEDKLDPEELSCEYQVTRGEMLERPLGAVQQRVDGRRHVRGPDAVERGQLVGCQQRVAGVVR